MKRQSHPTVPAADGRPSTVHVRIAARAVDAPDAVALVSTPAGKGNGNGRPTTFGELRHRASHVARRLRTLGVAPGQPVALCGERSTELVVGLLGILEAGAWYVPLDPAYPEERNLRVLRDCRPVARVLTAGATCPGDAPALIVGPGDDDPPAAASGAESEAHDAAYGMYTSGSTGAPKCVVVEHANIVNYVEAFGGCIGLSYADRYLHTASFAFSASVRQLLVPLACGAAVVLATSDEVRDPRALLSLMRRERVTVFDTVPSYLRQCASIAAELPLPERAALASGQLRVTLTTGEPLSREVARAWRAVVPPASRIVNLYGQTETTGSVAMHPIDAADLDGDGGLPIGRPLEGTRFQALDADGRPVEPGQVAELYVSGRSVARGYLGGEVLEQRRFADVDGAERVYRTGDLVRPQADGSYHYVGRVDDQVKVNGVRVDLGDVAAALREAAGSATDVAVLAREEDDRTWLVGYVATASAPAELAAQLRRALRTKLPDAMVPAQIVILPAFPRLPNGKLDRAALPASSAAPDPASATPVGPSGRPLLRALIRCWAAQLRVPTLAADADFFELGGDSLQAVELVANIQLHLPLDIPLIATFFDSPTPESMAEAIEAELDSADVDALVTELGAGSSASA